MASRLSNPGSLAGSIAQVPIGGIVAWAKSFTNTPVLPDQFLECNGQVIADIRSPYNGETLPNLNANAGGSHRFLRGSTTSGTTGGTETHNHNGDLATGGTGNITLGSIYRTTTEANLPTYYEVVWVMRIW